MPLIVCTKAFSVELCRRKERPFLPKNASTKPQLQSTADHHIAISQLVQAILSLYNWVNNLHSNCLLDLTRNGWALMFSFDSSRFRSRKWWGWAPVSISKVVGLWTKHPCYHILLWLIIEGSTVRARDRKAPVRHEVQRSLPHFPGSPPISCVFVHRWPIPDETISHQNKHNISIIWLI